MFETLVTIVGRAAIMLALLAIVGYALAFAMIGVMQVVDHIRKDAAKKRNEEE